MSQKRENLLREEAQEKLVINSEVECLWTYWGTVTRAPYLQSVRLGGSAVRSVLENRENQAKRKDINSSESFEMKQ
jgi:hypothetical protein